LERAYPTDFTLDELEKVLDFQKFFRVNRQFIINSDFIENIHTSPQFIAQLQAQPNETITISRDRVKDFKTWLVK
jgi:DNA-binding LytR/AlgR family response regulator